jgi:general secretion pathway protein D
VTDRKENPLFRSRYRVSLAWLLLPLLLAASGCAGNRAFTTGVASAQEGDWDKAVQSYEEAYRSDPSNKDYKIELRRARFEAAKEHIKRGNRNLAAKEYDRAMEEFQAALRFDPTFQTARNAFDLARTGKESDRAYESGLALLKAGRESEARESFARAVELNPANIEAAERHRYLVRKSQRPIIGQFEINLKSTKPITLKLADTSIKEAFLILSKLSGVNFLFDEDVKDKRVTLTLEDVRFEQALDMLTTVANLSRKVLSENTIIVYPTTPAKQSQYQDHFIRTFFLSNIDAKKAVNLVRSIIAVKKIFVNEELNAIVVRDDPDVINMVQKILDANDIADSELMLDVEILEVDRSKLLKLGLELSPTTASARITDGGSSGTTTGTTTATTSGGSVTLSTLSNLGPSNFLFTLPSVVANLRAENSGAEILANPKIRVKNHGKAKIHIGERVPIITSSTNLGVITENIQYQDVGVKLDVEPWIHQNNEVSMKVKLEVSTLGAQVSGTQTVAFRIGARTTETELRLHDRETQIIGGLINDEERTTVTRVPGLGDIPGLGYLFSSHDRNKVKTDILMSITPYILRNLSVPPKDVVSVWSGKENAVSSQRPAWDANEPKDDVVTTPKEGAAAVDAAAAGQSVSSAQASAVAEAAQQAATPVTLGMKGPREVQLGQQFEIEVGVEEAKGLFAVPLTMLFDPTRLKFLGAAEGEFLRQDGKLTSFVASPGAGKVTVGLSRLGEVGGIDGGGRLFTVRFQATAPGQAPVRILNPQLRDVFRRTVPSRADDYPLEIR